MDLQATKIELAKRILSETRESVLEKIAQMLSKNEEIVAHSVDGKPLNQEAYLRQTEEAEQDIKEGRVIDHQQLKNQIKSWGKR